MQVASGSFTGNGTSQSISGLGFTPELIIVRNNSASANTRMSFRTSDMSGDKTASTVGALANFASGITAINVDGFSVGSDVTCNESAKTIYWIAFRGNALNDFAHGVYTGNSTDNRNITGLGFQPDFVFIKNDGTARGRYRTASVSGDKSIPLENTVLTGADLIQSFVSDGFQVGTDVAVNASGQSYYWFAFKNVSGQFKEGTYTGNNTDNTSITGVGFQPIFVWIKGDTTTNHVSRFPSQIGDASFNNSGSSVETTNIIQAFEVDGFQVGTDVAVNTNAITYYYIAWKVPTAIVGYGIYGDEGAIS